MSVAKDEYDVGPLSWVKPEIELALQRADEGITRLSVSAGDPDIARAVLAHLHQVSGALLMVGLEPVAHLSEAMEKLVEPLGKGNLAIGPEITRAVRGAITALNQYLEGLMRGEPHRPLMLFPAYKNVVTAIGLDKASEVDLFYPDLSRRPKFSESAVTRVGPELASLLNLKRTEFQRGLLNLLRGKEVAQSLHTMRGALSSIEVMQPAGTRMLWWIAVGFLEGLANSSTPPDAVQKQLSGRIDLQIKRQVEGVDTVSERLMRELLFAIAKMLPVTERVREIQETYRLIRLLPPAVKQSPENTRVRLLLREIKEQLEAVKESWLKYTSGNRSSINQFAEQTSQLFVLAQSLGNPTFQTIFDKLAGVGVELKANPREPGETLALETATALLMARDALDNYQQLDSNFKRTAETAVSRLSAALKGQIVPGEGATQLADASRAAQEKLMFFQLGQEILTNLNQVEQLLDAFFRDPAKRADLSALPNYINQVQGALTMLESADAVNLVKASREIVERFIGEQGPADLKDAELAAEGFSNLGLFVSALQQGRANPDELLHPVLARFNIAPTRPILTPEGEPEESRRAIEQDLDGQKQSIAGLFERWQREPQELVHRAALVDALATIRQDAQLSGDIGLAEKSTQASTLVIDSSHQGPGTVREAFVAMLGASLLPEPPPAKPVGMVEPAAADVDAELLEVFLEEAIEVLGAMGIQRNLAMANHHDHEALTVIRRGFHTLKGSGRMVGLIELGEVAWQVEQVINKWLRDEKSTTKGLLRLIGDAHRSFGCWIDSLKAGGKPDVEAKAIFRLADQLKNDQEPAEEVPAPEPRAIVDIALPEPSLGTQDFAVAEDVTPAVPTLEPATPRRVHIGDVVLDADFFEIFANEARTHQATLLDQLAALRADPAEPVSHEFMRGAHTLMGISRTSGIAPIAHLGCGVEQWLLDRLDHPAPLAHEDVVLTGEAVEALAKMVEDVLEHRLPLPQPELADRLGARLDHIRAERRDLEARSAAAGTAAMRVSAALARAAEIPEPAEAAPVLAAIGETMPAQLALVTESESSPAELTEPMSAESSPTEATECSPALIVAAESVASPMPSWATPEPEALASTEPTELAEPPAPAADALVAETSTAVSEEPGVNLPPDRAPVIVSIPEVLAVQTLTMAESSEMHETPSNVQTVELTRPVTTHPTAQPATTALPEFEPGSALVESGKERRILSDDIDEQLLPLFLEEAFDLVPEVGKTLRTWRAAPGDKAPAALLGRHLHTLKGGARMAGVMRLGELTHVLENRVVAMKEAAHPAPADFEALEESFDRFTAALERLKSGGRAEEETVAGIAADEVTETVLRSPTRMAIIAPPRAAVAKSAAIGQVEEVDRRAVLRVRADLIDRFVNDAGEISIARSRIEGEMSAFRQGMAELTGNVAKLRAQLREIEIQAESQIQSSIQYKQEVGETFDPLEFDRFTRMQELSRFMAESVNDFVTLQQSLTRNLDETDAALAAQSRLNRELQQGLMSVRMVPLGNLADRLYRVVRQTAKELGKKANLEFKGVRAELDRGVLEKIVAPFEHLLRNAVAHGIESPEVREVAGKPTIGEITIDARQQANEILLTFSDDGDGINLERVREKAMQAGLLAANEMPTEEQLLQYIFVPGITTASEITQVAGRGVGLDVVKNAIVTLGGRIEVESTRGKGTRFTITLPLTLTVTQAVLVRANGTLYAVPSVTVEQVQEWKIAEISAIREKKEIVWQDQRYPFYSLSNLLGEERKATELRRYHAVMLLRSGAQRVAIEVDRIEGNREIVVKSIGPQLSRLTGISGATVLGNGQVLLILNPVLLAGREQGPGLMRTETKAEAAAQAPLILVVDDSLTVRKIATRLLSREGYQVITAKDGVDALQQLQGVLPDAMLVDIEMPRMDGFELTRNIRGDAKSAHIPIIMITSRTAEKHRNFAFSLGVNEYLGKPFQEDELLRYIARYVQQVAAA